MIFIFFNFGYLNLAYLSGFLYNFYYLPHVQGMATGVAALTGFREQFQPNQTRLLHGPFVIYPGFGTIQPGQAVTVRVIFIKCNSYKNRTWNLLL